ncbi:MAG: BlaI/MecI/CopY family transcriptional regulator [Gemmatimonadota bacterium]
MGRTDVPAWPVDEILSARERQVMEVLFRRRRATAAEIYEELPDAPSYNAVRGVLRILEEKGHAGHEREGRRYIYHPCSPAKAAGRSRLSRLSRTFFGGSAERVMSALFDEDPPDAAELERIERLIARARDRQGGVGE